MNKPRIPNLEELDQLTDFVLRRMTRDPNDEEIEAASGLVARASVAVYDSYMTDSPGYTGKLMAVVWPGAPNLYDVFVWRDGEMIHVEQDLGTRQDEGGDELAS